MVWPVVGHEWAVDLLSRSLESSRLRHAYLFVGPRQVGKRALVTAFAQAILCQGDVKPCGTCRACQLTAADRHPDVHVIEPEGERIKIEAIRAMQHRFALSPVEGAFRICILDTFDVATASAANALLKTLEEPPSTVILLLTATRQEALLPTIISRCQVVPLRPVPAEQIGAALRERGASDEQARLLAYLAQGRVGWAIAALQDARVLEERERVLDAVSDLAHASYTERFRWVERLCRKPDTVPGVLETMSSWWRDVLLAASGSQAPIANIDRRPEIEDWAVRHDTATARSALSAIRDTAWRLEHNANLRLALEVLVLDLPRIG